MAQSVAKLKALCRERGLKKTGNKGVLVERLLAPEVEVDGLSGAAAAVLPVDDGESPEDTVEAPVVAVKEETAAA